MFRLTQAFLDALFPFLIREPPVALNRTCRPPPLPPPDAINCSVGHRYARTDVCVPTMSVHAYSGSARARVVCGVCVCVCVYRCVCVPLCVCLYESMYVYMYVCMSMCVCL